MTVTVTMIVCRALGGLIQLCWRHMSFSWKAPIGDRLLNETNVPIVFIFAEKDGIVPNYMFNMVSSLKNGDAFVVYGASHMSILHGRFARALCEILETSN